MSSPGESMDESSQENRSLVFVYNADSGPVNTLLDIAHKIVSPGTYDCALCDLSHGYFTARAEWKQFIATLGMDCEFLHRNEAVEKYKVKEPLPAVYVKQGQDLRPCLSADEIDSCQSTAELVNAVTKHCCSNSGKSNT